MTENQKKSSPSLLLVDDDRLVLATISTGLQSAGYRTHTAESVDEAETWLDNNERPDLVLLDMSMPGRDGLELTPKLTEMNSIPFISLTAYSEKEMVENAKQAGAIGYLVKPVNIAQIIPAIETALARAKELKGLQKNGEMLQTALDGDRAVSVAVGIMMVKNGLNNAQAFETIRKTARSNHKKLIDVANSIIEATETLNMVSNNAAKK